MLWRLFIAFIKTLYFMQDCQHSIQGVLSSHHITLILMAGTNHFDTGYFLLRLRWYSHSYSLSLCIWMKKVFFFKKKLSVREKNNWYCVKLIPITSELNRTKKKQMVLCKINSQHFWTQQNQKCKPFWGVKKDFKS